MGFLHLIRFESIWSRSFSDSFCMIYPCKTWECRDEPIFVFHFDAALGWIKPLNALNGRWMFMCGPASSCCTYALGEKFRGLVLQKLMLPMLGLYLILGNGPKKGSHQTCWKQPMPWQIVRVFQWFTLSTLIAFLELCSNNLFAYFTCFDMELALAPDTGAWLACRTGPCRTKETFPFRSLGLCGLATTHQKVMAVGQDWSPKHGVLPIILSLVPFCDFIAAAHSTSSITMTPHMVPTRHCQTHVGFVSFVNPIKPSCNVYC